MHNFAYISSPGWSIHVRVRFARPVRSVARESTFLMRLSNAEEIDSFAQGRDRGAHSSLEYLKRGPPKPTLSAHRLHGPMAVEVMEPMVVKSVGYVCSKPICPCRLSPALPWGRGLFRGPPVPPTGRVMKTPHHPPGGGGGFPAPSGTRLYWFAMFRQS